MIMGLFIKHWYKLLYPNCCKINIVLGISFCIIWWKGTSMGSLKRSFGQPEGMETG